MQIFQGPQELDRPLSSSVVTIGNFDGVHLGHQQLIEMVVREAQSLNAPGVVYTFNPHPLRILRPDLPVHRLFDLRDQQEQLDKRGIDYIFVKKFTSDFAKKSPADFLENEIFRMLNPKTLVVGHDFSFGQDRIGNIPFLESFCASRGVRLIVIPPFRLNGLVVSSTQIRGALRRGDLVDVERLLGRPFYLRGKVEKGFERGRTIGVPTANLHPDVEFEPRLGVYMTSTAVSGKWHPSITNIGVNPTFHGGEKKPLVKIETHLLNYDSNLYGQEIEVRLLFFIRDEIKFSGLDQLKQQIELDIKRARDWHHV